MMTIQFFSFILNVGSIKCYNWSLKENESSIAIHLYTHNAAHTTTITRLEVKVNLLMVPLGQVVGFLLNMIQADEIWTTSKKTHTIQ